jgi:hypothetical protein
MILNVTVHIESHLEGQWLIWVKKIPADLQRDFCFSKLVVSEVMAKEEGLTYALQFFFVSKNDYQNHAKGFKTAFVNCLADEFGAAALYFFTPLKIIYQKKFNKSNDS